ncbi:MAG: hypothetical protein HQL95_07380 [Magnetococcales bacterium]|nr:hypothetical protein [Magnetococcales bacterium]
MRHDTDHLSRLLLMSLAAMGSWCAFTTSAQAEAEALIVYKAAGVTLTPGQTINGTQPLRLTAGQSVELIGANGRIIKLKGPHDQPPAPDGADKGEKLAAALKAMVSGNAADPNHMGVTRSADEALKNGGKGWLPEPWVINVTVSGKHCQRAGEPLIFWRPDKEKESEIRLATLGNTWKATTRWPAGKEKLAPPATMPVKEDAVYQITLDNAKTDLTLNLIPENVTAPPVLAAWMKESGCHAQSLALLRTLP